MARVLGKLIGGVLGFALGGGPLGALIGIVIGHAHDTRPRLQNYGGWSVWDAMPGYDNADTAGRNRSAPLYQSAYTHAVIILGAKTAKAGGVVTRAGIDAFKKAFHIAREEEDNVATVFDSASRSAEGYEPYAFHLAHMLADRPDRLETVMAGLFAVAAADGVALAPAKARLLMRVASVFGLSPAAYARMAARAGVRLPGGESYQTTATRGDLGWAFSILEISGTSSNDEIKAGYRALILKHHPDRLAASGADAAAIAAATEKVKRINAAYDALSRARGIK